MATLPTALSLATIGDGTAIIAADHRNNYAAIQTDVNALLTILGAGAAADQFFTGNGTTVSMAYPPGHEFGYDQITAPVTDSSTVEAGTTVIACGAHIFDGAPVMADFFSPDVNQPNATGALVINLFEGATQIGRLAFIVGATGGSRGPVCGRLRFTPTAGSHTYTVTAFHSVGAGTIGAGAGGAATEVPAYIRFTKV